MSEDEEILSGIELDNEWLEESGPEPLGLIEIVISDTVVLEEDK